MRYEKTDYWNLFVHIGELLSKGCADLIEKSRGCPSNMEMEEWWEILGQIKEAGDHMVKHGDCSVDEFDPEKIRKGLEALKNYWPHLWD